MVYNLTMLGTPVNSAPHASACETLAAPGIQRFQHRGQGPTSRGEVILVTRRVLLVSGALDQAGSFQPLEPFCQDVGLDSFAGLEKLGEAMLLLEEISNDQ